MVKKLIGICGLKGSGKDSTANELIDEYDNWEKMSFASTLKDIASILFGMDRDMLEGSTKENRFKREVPDEFWSKKLGRDFTPRQALQELGTDILRNHFHQDIWVDALERKLLATDKNIVITDCRFPNEIDMIRRLGGEIWRVERDIPDWFRKVESFQKDGTDNLQYDLPYYVPELNTIHESEWRWIGYDKPNLIVHCTGKFEDLRKQVVEYFNKNEM